MLTEEYLNNIILLALPTFSLCCFKLLTASPTFFTSRSRFSGIVFAGLCHWFLDITKLRVLVVSSAINTRNQEFESKLYPLDDMIHIYQTRPWPLTITTRFVFKTLFKVKWFTMSSSTTTILNPAGKMHAYFRKISCRYLFFISVYF